MQWAHVKYMRTAYDSWYVQGSARHENPNFPPIESYFPFMLMLRAYTYPPAALRSVTVKSSLSLSLSRRYTSLSSNCFNSQP